MHPDFQFCGFLVWLEDKSFLSTANISERQENDKKAQEKLNREIKQKSTHVSGVVVCAKETKLTVKSLRSAANSNSENEEVRRPTRKEHALF